ncbi:MAG: molybdenum cofactor synthesis domain-containing protein [Dethiobacteria bacterium]|nr:molybdenum cofactor synthesis domain-containing protein [Dethiobacteria bacterium]
MAEIIAVCTSAKKGERKKNVGESNLIKSQGLENDAHAGFAHRQVSLLAEESIAKMTAKGLDVGPGDFAENLTTRGIDLVNLPLGTRLAVGKEVILRVTQIGKECHNRCAIYYQAGDCVMPREGIFAEVLLGGKIKVEDKIEIKHSYKFGVITASDKGSRGEREDLSGPTVGEMLLPFGDVIDYVIVPDDRAALAKMMRNMVTNGFDAILTTGGTGMSPRDITPEATLDVIERMVPGIPEAIRRETAAATAKAMLSRGIAGISGATLIINLPGSPKAVAECLAVITPVLEHALDTVSGRGGECAR